MSFILALSARESFLLPIAPFAGRKRARRNRRALEISSFLRSPLMILPRRSSADDRQAPAAQAARRLTAFGPLPMRSGSTSKVTFWPSTRVRRPEASIAEMWTNTSLAPPSGVMKPKPLVALKNFTVPVWAMGKLLHPYQSRGLARCVAPWVSPGVARQSCIRAWSKPPPKNGAVRDSHYRGRVIQNVPLSGSQMPEHEIYYTET
ncbi:hypothetical protein MPLB_1540072 [Mesorhizobium sp. ORS 3324]|nr:hypothetical protein MPLB_1540072 [Mesorhizobium sp. ORS 3324]